MLGLGVPSKAYFSMAADKPILAVMDERAEVSIMVKEHNIGWICPAGNPQELAKYFDDIYLERNIYKVNSPRKILADFYSEEVALGKFINCIRDTHEIQ